MINKGFLNTNTAIMRQLTRTARVPEAEWRQVLQGNVSTAAKEDETSTGRVWAAQFNHVAAHSRLMRILKMMTI
jgi:hypothetical protein